MREYKSKYLYMAVTKDDLQLPLFVGTAKEVAEYAHTDYMTVITGAYHAEKNAGQHYSYVRVPI